MALRAIYILFEIPLFFDSPCRYNWNVFFNCHNGTEFFMHLSNHESVCATLHCHTLTILMVPTTLPLYQVWVVVFPINSVSVEHQRASLLQAGGHPDGELGLVSCHAPGLRHRHDVAPRVQRVTVPTWRWNRWWQLRTIIFSLPKPECSTDE